ncbi:MAG: hypothetical protein FRX49_04606 [Trebouxia sp. A1-2]|nr:MAG: hypothetical protein FRX49_04606 [Trebouxia sp. A1-2]
MLVGVYGNEQRKGVLVKFPRYGGLLRTVHSILQHIDVRMVVPLVNPHQQLPQPPGHHPQPFRVCLDELQIQQTRHHLVSGRVGQRLKEVRVGHYANLAIRQSMSEALYSSSVGKQHMMAHPPIVCGVPVTGGMHPNVVPHLCSASIRCHVRSRTVATNLNKGPGLVEGGPVFDTVSKGPEADVGILSKKSRPAWLGTPVPFGWMRGQAIDMRNALIPSPFIMLISCSRQPQSDRLPWDKPDGPEPDRTCNVLQDIDMMTMAAKQAYFLVAVIEVDCNISSVAFVCASLLMAEGIPDRHAPATLLITT